MWLWCTMALAWHGVVGIVQCGIAGMQKVALNGREGSILLCLLFSETGTEARTTEIGEIHNWTLRTISKYVKGFFM